MAKRLYNIGVDHEIDWSKNEKINSNSFPIEFQNMELDDHRIEQQFHITRHVSSPSLMSSRQSMFRNGHNSFPGLSLHIQSMKRSAFKMLRKLNTSYRRKD